MVKSMTQKIDVPSQDSLTKEILWEYEEKENYRIYHSGKL